MDANVPDPTHALSGHNPTLFNAVLQYADMDMLRALAVTTPLLYEALQHCRFDHLTLVVLEAPILKEQQQVVYNGADPVSSDTFRLPLNNIVAAPLVERPSSTSPAPSTPPSPKTRHQVPTFPDSHAFDTWQQRSTIFNNYCHNLNIPDYARNFMTRARSVELVVYRRRLGTRISSFFTNNAHQLKHGKPTAPKERASCSESNESPTETTQYTLHPPCAPTQHCDTNDGHAPDYNTCVFSKHPSHEYFEGDVAEPRCLSLRMVPNHFTGPSAQHFPYASLPSLRLNLLLNTIATATDSEGRGRTKRKRHTTDAFYRDGRFCIAADDRNTHVFRPRFQNLPLAEQNAPTTSLSIRIVDRVSFGAGDWTNAIPGCTVQPVQTWVIHDDANAPQHPHHPAELADHNDNKNNNEKDIGHHFPRLINLVLEYTHLDVDNRCDIDNFDMPDHITFGHFSNLSHFFIGDCPIHLPHLQHFGVIGTLLDYGEYVRTLLDNAHISSLNINPGPQSTNRDASRLTTWIYLICTTLDQKEHFATLSSSASAAVDGDRQEDIATNSVNHHEGDDEQDITNRRPPQPCDESTSQVETGECRRTARPCRKYNFSFDFASSDSEGCCQHGVDTSTQRALANAHMGARTNMYDQDIPTLVDQSQFGQHLTTCTSIHNALSIFYLTDRVGSENSFKSVLLGLPDWPNELPTGVRHSEVIAASAIFKLLQRVHTHLEMRCHYCALANPGSTPFPGASRGDCTATHLPPSANALLGITDEALTGMSGTQPDEEIYMRLRQLLDIPPHVVLRL